VKPPTDKLRENFGWRLLPLWVAIAYTIVRLPFIGRYDLWFGSDIAVNYLQAKRILHGEIPLYFWSQDYYGTFTQFLVALAFKLVGASIPLANLINILIWAASVALAVAYVRRAFGRYAALFGGGALVVGVPWFLHYEIPYFGSQYNLAALIVFGFLWLGLNAIQSPSVLRTIILGGLAGFCFYVNKQIIVPGATLLIVYLSTKENRAALRRVIRPSLLAAFTAAFLVGYTPELRFKLRSDSWHNRPRDPAEAFYRRRELLGVATPAQMVNNVYWLARVLPAYFDGDPLWRQQAGIHYLDKMENQESFPQSTGDVLGIFVGFLVVCYLWRQAKRSHALKNNWQLAFAAVPFVNAGLVIIGGVTGASYYSAIRYIFPAGSVLLIGVGLFLYTAVQRKRWVLVGLLTIWLAQSFVHRYQLLALPDELRDFRRVIADLRAHDVHYGATWYPYAHVLTALSDEQIVFASVDRDAYSTYLRQVKQCNDLVLVYPTYRPQLPPYIQKLVLGGQKPPLQKNPPPDARVVLWSQSYRRVDEPHECGEMSWCRIEKAPDRGTGQGN
jgi:hypothetical protein